MSGAGDRPEIELFQAGQVSRRLVQLRAILDLVRRDAPEAGTVAGLWDSFAALAEVQRHNPLAVTDLLSGPQVGAWAARCLRRLTGRSSATPLWVHLAHLGAVAAAAAIRSGVRVEVRVPVRSGTVSLPTIGRAAVDRPERWALAMCTSGDPLLLDGSAPLDWQPVRLLRTGQLVIPFDYTDPYWSCFGLPVTSNLDDRQVERWRGQFENAWAILTKRHQHRLAAITAAIRCLVPVDRGGLNGGVSASSGDAPGAVALTEPTSPERLAATLVHEVQHFRLYALHDLVPLYRTAGQLLLSPWRNDPRRLPGLLHGTVAFLGVAEFWSGEWPVSGRGAELTYARTVRQLRVGCRILNDSPDLTPTGRALVAELTAAIGRLPESGIAGDVHRLAADLVAHHRAAWRLRNIMPDPAEVTALTDASLRGKRFTASAAPADRTTTTATPGGDSPLFRLAVAWVEDPDRVRAAAPDPAEFELRYPGANVADLPLIVGDHAQAQAVRLAQIAGGATDADTWASLSVAHGRLCVEPTLSPLAVRPELVRAAWPRIAAAGRDPLTELVTRYVAGTSTSDSMRR